MNVEIGAEAVLFPEKEYLNGIFVVVWFFGALKNKLWIFTTYILLYT